MLATLVAELPAGTDWLFEPKLDGIRAVAVIRDGTATLFSRNHKALGGAYPELVEALALDPPADAVLDGEIVAIDPGTRLSSFSRLQRRSQRHDATEARASGVAVTLFLFDCLFFAGADLTALPLIERKAILREAVRFGPQVVFTPFRTRGAAAMLRRACARGAEGVVAKRADSPYVGARSADWLKIKCVHQQEFVIGGYTAPQGGRAHLGALLVGYYDGRSLRYAGKVGTGFDSAMLSHLYHRLAPLRRSQSPFASGAPSRHSTWVAPRLVAEIGFTEWTAAGLLRHPRFLGLRDDKAAHDVRREG